MPQSRPPKSSQTRPHERLDEIVERHLDRPWRAPIHDHSRVAFERLREHIEPGRRLIVDAGCGTGASTALLAGRHRDCQVIGVDKSAARLEKAGRMPPNARLVRAELADFWRLALAAGWRPARHYLFYPNPWPKPGQLKRRWHAHPVFPVLLTLGGRLEVRTNFEIYALEFARALERAGVVEPEVVSFSPDQPVSPFERKYAASGHRLFKLTVQLENGT